MALAAAERSIALLVILENVDGYGPTDGLAMSEDMLNVPFLGDKDPGGPDDGAGWSPHGQVSAPVRQAAARLR